MQLHKALLVALLAVQTANASTLTVTSTANSGAGSLRDALASAADGDTIDFSVTGTIWLTSGELLVAKNLSILGPGAKNLAVDANHTSRVFHIAPSNTVSISGLTIANGQAGSNQADTGGGIYNDHATLSLSNCTVSGSSARAHGGGIYNDGLYGSASLQVINCTLSGNSAQSSGGGIANQGYPDPATLTIENTTISGNSGFYSGGIASFNGAATIRNCTLSGNSASSEYGASSIASYGGNVEIGSTILNVAGPFVGNFIHNGPVIWPGPVTSLGYNLSSDAASGLLNATGDQINTDPLLGPLQDNGGPTLTHVLLGCSPAIEQGKNLSGSFTDQRGGGLGRTFDDPAVANATGGDGTDIGAFEAQTHVFDTTPPTVSPCPADMVVNATSPAGAVVSYTTPTASDNCAVADVSCSPVSGSTFAIGATTVSCVAMDGMGLMSRCAFTIYVKGAAEQLNDLIAYVQGLPLETGVKNGLLVKLQDALNGVNANKKPKACGALQDFINLCNAQAAKRNLDANTTNYLIGEATRIRAVIGC